MSNSSLLTISSNTLFHFTDEIGNVINILKEGFKPHFCLEDLNFVLPDEPTGDLEHAIPMVCFCDVPLSQSKTHREIYGNYGIGLSKEWGEQNNISPVLYAYQESAITDTIMRMWIEVSNFKTLGGQQDADDPVNRFYDYIYGVYCFTKPYKGKKWMNKDKDYSKEPVRFYDDREWRFVPMREDRFEYGLSKKEFLNISERNKYNRELWKQTVLCFEPSDVRYIIVSNADEIVRIITETEKIMDGYNQADITLLSSKVISAEQIDEDF